MLRIFVFEEPTSVKLRLEGGLTVATVPLLLEHWADVCTRLKGRVAILDLGDVPEVDDAGRSTLSWLAHSGLQIGYAHPNVRDMVEGLACDTPALPRLTASLRKRLHLASCDKYWDFPLRPCRFICALLPAAWRPCGCRTT